MSAQDRLNYYTAQLDKELSKYPALNNLEKQSGIPKAYAALGVGFLFTFLIFFNIAAGFLTNLLGWVLPAYFSMRALETPHTGDDVQWLTYWVVYGAFQIVETFADLVLYWFPFYYTGKAILILWLVLPQTKGASMVYQRALRPLVANTQSRTTSDASATPSSAQ